MKTRKFQADKSHGVGGFWRPEKKGEAIEGIIRGKVESTGIGKDWLVIELSDSCDVISRDRDTGDELDRTLKKGMNAGVTLWAGLRGLDRFEGHFVRIEFLGEVKTKGERGEMVRTKEFDIDLSETPVGKSEKAEPSRKNGAKTKKSRAKSEAEVSDDDIPF